MGIHIFEYYSVSAEKQYYPWGSRSRHSETSWNFNFKGMPFKDKEKARESQRKRTRSYFERHPEKKKLWKHLNYIRNKQKYILRSKKRRENNIPLTNIQKKESYERSRDKLTDVYITCVILRHCDYLTYRDIKNEPELIRLKRLEIESKRKAKEENNQ